MFSFLLGIPKGLRTIEKSNWSGLGLVFPRDDFSEQVRLREEIQHPGVYILWGPGSQTIPTDASYIGECDTLVDRLVNHNNTDDKPFWQETIVFTSTDRNLNKAHVLFIEAQLVNIAKQANRCDLTNKQNPSEPNLSDREKKLATGISGSNDTLFANCWSSFLWTSCRCARLLKSLRICGSLVVLDLGPQNC